jgi:hypothetical protein
VGGKKSRERGVMPKLMNSDSGQGAERAEGTTGRKRGARACVNSVSGEGAENRKVAAEACIDENRGEGAGAANRKSSAGAGVNGECENGAHEAKNKKTASKPASTASAETGERRGHCWICVISERGMWGARASTEPSSGVHLKICRTFSTQKWRRTVELASAAITQAIMRIGCSHARSLCICQGSRVVVALDRFGVGRSHPQRAPMARHGCRRSAAPLSQNRKM